MNNTFATEFLVIGEQLLVFGFTNYKLNTANDELILGRRSTTGVSQKTCQGTHISEAFEEKATNHQQNSA